MKKKILIGSIISIAILIGISFTSVVGYQSTSKTIADISPLFNIRTSRALNEESKELTYDYVGKGEESILSIPKRDNRMEGVQRFVDTINKMDDGTFNRFIDFLINHKGKRIKEENIPAKINVLQQFKINPDKLKDYIADEKENIFYTEEYCETVGFIWVPGCFIALIMTYLIWLVLSFASLILDCH